MRVFLCLEDIRRNLKVDPVNRFSSEKATAVATTAAKSWTARATIKDMSIAKSCADHTLQLDAPEGSASQILDFVMARNYGKLALVLMNWTGDSVGRIAGKARRDLKDTNIAAWEITGVEGTAPACVWIDVKITKEIEGRVSTREFRMRMNYERDDRKPLPRNLGGGTWRVMAFKFALLAIQ